MVFRVLSELALCPSVDCLSLLNCNLGTITYLSCETSGSKGMLNIHMESQNILNGIC